MIASSFSIVLFLVDYIAVLVFVFKTNKLPINNSLIQFHASFVCFFFLFLKKDFETTRFEQVKI